MFPDFPEYKRLALKLLLRRVVNTVGEIEPLLREVRQYRQHEGHSGKLERSDGSTDIIDFPAIGSEFTLSHEEMKSLDLQKIEEKLMAVARDFAAGQMKLLIKKISEATEAVGNTVSAGGSDLKPEHFLEMLRKIWIDFDPKTGEPRLPTFLVHPSQAEKLRGKMQQWLDDPEVTAEQTRIMQEKFEEWRARENLRKLVD